MPLQSHIVQASVTQVLVCFLESIVLMGSMGQNVGNIRGWWAPFGSCARFGGEWSSTPTEAPRKGSDSALQHLSPQLFSILPSASPDGVTTGDAATSMVFAILVFFTFTPAWAVRTVDLSATRAGPEIIAYNEVAIPSVSQLEAVMAVKKNLRI